MKLALIGVGQAGGKIVDRFVEYDKQHNSGIVSGAVAINTAEADLLGLEHVPKENRELIGQSRVKGHGVGADNELGATVAEEDIQEIMDAIDHIPVHSIDAFLVVGALGGGTGSGASPVIAERLQELYTEPVYGLGILPGENEGSIYTLNAARSFKTFVDKVDNLILFDNDAWRQTGQSISEGYAELNDELVRRLGVLFSAGEVDNDATAEAVVDASEIINTLNAGGVSTIGYETDSVETSSSGGLLSKLTGGSEEESIDEKTNVNQITSLIRKATLGQLTIPVEIDSAESALVVVAGPEEKISRKGIEEGRGWVEDNTGTMEVRGGDYPIPSSDHLAGVVLLSGVTDIPRIKKLQQVAIEAQETKQELEQKSQDELEDLVNDDDDELDPLF